MSDYKSRIYIEVKNKSDWKKLYDLNVIQYDLWAELFHEIDGKILYLDGDWHCEEGQLFHLLLELTMRIPDCIIFADTSNYEATPYNHILYYLGDRIKTRFVDECLQPDTSLQEPYDWFKRHHVRLSKKQKEYMMSFNINP